MLARFSAPRIWSDVHERLLLILVFLAPVLAVVASYEAFFGSWPLSPLLSWEIVLGPTSGAVMQSAPVRLSLHALSLITIVTLCWATVIPPARKPALICFATRLFCDLFLLFQPYLVLFLMLITIVTVLHTKAQRAWRNQLLQATLAAVMQFFFPLTFFPHVLTGLRLQWLGQSCRSHLSHHSLYASNVSHPLDLAAVLGVELAARQRQRRRAQLAGLALGAVCRSCNAVVGATTAVAALVARTAPVRSPRGHLHCLHAPGHPRRVGSLWPALGAWATGTFLTQHHNTRIAWCGRGTPSTLR